MNSAKSVLRNTETVTYQTLAKIKLLGEFKTCLICIVKNNEFSYEQAVFIIRTKSMFRKSKIILIFPLTIEALVLPYCEGFSFSWAEEAKLLCILIVCEDLIKKVTSLCNDYARYQQEPFCLGCSHHKWLWFYQEFIPKPLHTPYSSAFRLHSLLNDHYGKSVMEAYVSEKLKNKEQEFTTNEQITLAVLSWNAAGGSPKGNLSEWFLCQSKKYEFAIESPDIFVIGLQEMCELSKLLGDSAREQEWVWYLKKEIQEVFPGSNYVIVCQVSLVGLMNVVFAKEAVAQRISGLSYSQVKLGIKGFAGNKGALAVRLEIFGSTFCLINAHLAPHKQNFRLRNENVNTITRSIKFTLPHTSHSMFEHDYIFWFGDLNYRIDTLSTGKIIKYITKNDFASCLEYDQLITARKFHNILDDFFEGNIEFLPTFKYLIGSNQHNVRRDPAWCDRVLWRGKAILHRYGSCDSIQVSDHKPVFAYFDLRLKAKNLEKMTFVKNEIYKEIDEMHHQAMPKASISANKLTFEEVHYKFSYEQNFEILNIGNSELKFNILSDKWVKCSPDSYSLTINELVSVKVTITFDAEFYKSDRIKQSPFIRFIRIAIHNGSEYLIELECNRIDTFIGYSCELLCKKFPSLEYHSISLPIVRIIDYLKSTSLKLKNLFESVPDNKTLAHIIAIIDRNEKFDAIVTPFAMIHVLQEFLLYLNGPLIDGNLVDTKINMLHLVGFSVVKLQVYEALNAYNAACLKYLVDLMKGFAANRKHNCMNSTYIANKMYKSIFQIENISADKKKNRILYLEMLFSA